MLATFHSGYRFTKRNFALISVIALLITSSVFAFASGFWLFYRTSYLLLAALPLSYLWARLNLAGLEVKAERHPSQVQAGQSVTIEVDVSNRLRLPKTWLEIKDESGLPGYGPKTVLSLSGGKSGAFTVTARCLRRGLYALGPITITSNDPLGLFHLTRKFGRPQNIVVYPLPVEIENFWAPPANLPGEGRLRRRTHFVTPNASGVREYTPGDGLNRIHWNTTARLGRLMVKTFELDPSSDLWVALDLESGPQAGAGEESTEEYGVSIAASIVRHFIGANRAVGYLAYGSKLDFHEPDRSHSHYNQILEALALARATGVASLSHLLRAEERHFGRHTTLIVITPSTRESWVGALQSMMQRGVRVVSVLLEPASFGAQSNSLLVIGQLAAADIPTYLVRRGDDLASALNPASQTIGASKA